MARASSEVDPEDRDSQLSLTGSDRSKKRGKRKAKTSKPDEPPPFEESVRRLAQIVDELESGDLALEEAIGVFEEGVRLARTSQARLDKAEKRVEELLAVDEDGNPVVREIDLE